MFSEALIIFGQISNELSNQKMRGILGMHDWETTFTNYDKEEGITHSRIFYSTFSSRRDVEKTGADTSGAILNHS